MLFESLAEEGLDRGHEGRAGRQGAEVRVGGQEKRGQGVAGGGGGPEEGQEKPRMKVRWRDCKSKRRGWGWWRGWTWIFWLARTSPGRERPIPQTKGGTDGAEEETG